MQVQPIILERGFDEPIIKVWKAITDKAEMEKWYFTIDEFIPEIGFEFQFEGGTDQRRYLHRCKIVDITIGKKLSYSWKYDNYEGLSMVTFELFSEGNKTRLKLTHTGIETFPGDNHDFSRESFLEGWNYIIGISLPAFFEKETFSN